TIEINNKTDAMPLSGRRENKMANLYKGYRIDFTAFWNYYKGTVRVDYSQYSRMFNNCFMYEMDKAGYPQGLHSNTVNLVQRDLTRLCRDTRMDILSKGAPDAAIKSITSYFKKWVMSYYK
ncbi:MAG: hypothetical protein LUH53_02025, partial [Lachnospiraceae bacterium]|nr:hypothetical protein [Lachnospiraceae bacterium]